MLQLFQFGPSLIRWIQMFYNIQSCVINNGWAIEAFNLTCDVHQGCTISLYFFMLCAYILAINKSPDIMGIKIEQQEYKRSQYADNTSVTTEGSENCLLYSFNNNF